VALLKEIIWNPLVTDQQFDEVFVSQEKSLLGVYKDVLQTYVLINLKMKSAICYQPSLLVFYLIKSD
jgi:S-adenosylmethionine:diacylglycerol 3-amino-3-carboxypropyl transferase